MYTVPCKKQRKDTYGAGICGEGKGREEVKVDYGRNLRRVVTIQRSIIAVGGILLSLITGPLPLRHAATLLTGYL